ncbi:MAG TPA: hypothetical protein VMC03_21960 [Streptosporangiaceae bacterium]|nr:hypothetical protein [Streptosporangiaceae bacterium]
MSALALLAGCGGGTSSKPPAPAGLASLPAKKIVSEATAAAKAADWVSAGLTAKAGSTSMSSAGVIGPSAGRETIKIAGNGQATIIVIGRLGYVHGSAAVLKGFLQLSAADARLARKWVVFRPRDPGYQKVVPGMTLDSFLSEVIPNGPLTKTKPTTIDGQAVIGVRAKAPASADMPPGTTDTVYVAATGKPLPVECVEAISTGDVIVTFTGWGQQMAVKKPVHTVPAPAGSGTA